MALALSGLRFTNKEHQSKGNVGLTTPHKNLNTMAKGSGNTRSTRPYKKVGDKQDMTGWSEERIRAHEKTERLLKKRYSIGGWRR